ncbi:MAG: hypothetical protein A3G49_01105 [Candidatus Sungbacteria bacterium RIFCSPLOWO2_12_FULL_41_11]|uniref:Uncharacterized protein n=1 Tax=Candidatus Sungbacteria bacterium RIFCSPLOWO2_12_FULL_41_11 TaxID=1802286 RepID=A0A1G2LRK1_9BACT|nr:MAG: hypothetical protein A3D41_05655 [Candidatus Sungbacteria bacterium RIFCSPHIGHO2_02_FULL_41_12b]OHA13421.1 MAG: hypothetical protein A3G49_01105 [Candidatus Sungbacteria bacterium RIFCSPLOWO2_12_FULL_41_11]
MTVFKTVRIRLFILLTNNNSNNILIILVLCKNFRHRKNHGYSQFYIEIIYKPARRKTGAF